MEIQRVANVAPIDYRSISEPVDLDGILIPKNTLIFNILTEVMKGPHWKDAEKFQPERFLDGSDLIEQDERFMPFLMGKRRCPGETLVTKQLFLYFTRILQLFDVEAEDGEVLSPDSFAPGITSKPVPFKAKFYPRSSSRDKISNFSSRIPLEGGIKRPKLGRHEEKEPKMML